MALYILRNGDVVPSLAARRGQYPDWIAAPIRESWGDEIVVVDPREGLPPGLLEAEAVILSGSPSSVTEEAPWMLQLEEALRGLLARGTPVLGICFGHQLIAKAMGGEVQRNPRGREIGTVEVQRLADDPIFAGLPPCFEANATHLDTITRLPEGARLLATSALDQIAAYTLGSARCVQFHPEMDGDILRSLMEVRRPILEAEGFAVDEMIARTVDTTSGPTILQNFIRSLHRQG